MDLSDDFLSRYYVCIDDGGVREGIFLPARGSGVFTSFGGLDLRQSFEKELKRLMMGYKQLLCNNHQSV